jgi:hypothetical protein
MHVPTALKTGPTAAATCSWIRIALVFAVFVVVASSSIVETVVTRCLLGAGRDRTTRRMPRWWWWWWWRGVLVRCGREVAPVQISRRERGHVARSRHAFDEVGEGCKVCRALHEVSRAPNVERAILNYKYVSCKFFEGEKREKILLELKYDKESKRHNVVAEPTAERFAAE